MNQTVPYLAGTANEQLNFEAGENVLLTLDPGARFQNFLVTGPDAEDHRVARPLGQQRFLEIVAPQMLGQWTVMAKDAENRQTRLGFSLNPPRPRASSPRSRPRTSTRSSARMATPWPRTPRPSRS